MAEWEAISLSRHSKVYYTEKGILCIERYQPEDIFSCMAEWEAISLSRHSKVYYIQKKNTLYSKVTAGGHIFMHGRIGGHFLIQT
jgi:hypothetical protein